MLLNYYTVCRLNCISTTIKCHARDVQSYQLLKSFSYSYLVIVNQTEIILVIISFFGNHFYSVIVYL